MFGSQALETAIGLVTMFFVLATAASMITEVIARLLHKRAKDLERGLAAMMAGKPVKRGDLHTVLGWFKATSVWKTADAATGKALAGLVNRKPSYLSAKMFAEGVLEMLEAKHLDAPGQAVAQAVAPDPAETAPAASWLARLGTLLGRVKAAVTGAKELESQLPAHLPENLQKRLHSMYNQGRKDALSMKAGIEGWYDEAMGRVEGSYKRWATAILFVIGAFLAVSLNLSATHTASSLWKDPVTRDAVTSAAQNLIQNGGDVGQLDSVATTADQIKVLRIPGGWTPDREEIWRNYSLWHMTQSQWNDLLGWLLTAVLVMLGGPFWFDLLNRLVSLRGAGTKPALATADDASATSVTSNASTAAANTKVPATSSVTITTTPVPGIALDDAPIGVPVDAPDSAAAGGGDNDEPAEGVTSTDEDLTDEQHADAEQLKAERVEAERMAAASGQQPPAQQTTAQQTTAHQTTAQQTTTVVRADPGPAAPMISPQGTIVAGYMKTLGFIDDPQE